MAHLGLSDLLLKTGRLQEAADVAVRSWETLRRLGLAGHRNACGLLGCAVEALFGLGRWDEAARISEPLAHQPASFANAILQPKLADLETAAASQRPRRHYLTRSSSRAGGEARTTPGTWASAERRRSRGSACRTWPFPT